MCSTSSSRTPIQFDTKRLVSYLSASNMSYPPIPLDPEYGSSAKSPSRDILESSDFALEPGHETCGTKDPADLTR